VADKYIGMEKNMHIFTKPVKKEIVKHQGVSSGSTDQLLNPKMKRLNCKYRYSALRIVAVSSEAIGKEIQADSLFKRPK
jgi:hypothetical protein